MARAAIERGYEYLAICDHTVAVSVVPGLDADAVRRQGEEIAAANERLAPFRVLRGIECDIRADATLDLPDDVLAELDWVMASVHAGQRGSRDELTKRTVEAMYHPSVSAISHPTGRLIDRRAPNALDLDTAFAVALETGTAARDERPPRPARPEGRARPSSGGGRHPDRRLDRRPLDAWAREHRPRARDSPAGLGDGRGRRQHAPARGDPGVEEAGASRPLSPARWPSTRGGRTSGSRAARPRPSRPCARR